MTVNTTLIEAQTDAVNDEIKSGRARFYASADELRDLRVTGLRSLLEFAKNESPWYTKTLAHVDVDNFTEDQLHQIPPLDKPTLMANWDQIVTNPDLTLEIVEAHTARMSEDDELLFLDDRFHVLSTSGSSGTRGVYVYDWHEWVQRNAWSRRVPWLTADAQPITFSQKKITMAQVVITNPVYGMYASSKTFSVKWLDTLYIPVTLTIPEICSRLDAQPIDVLMGIPSTVHKLCLEAREGRLSIEPKVVYVSGEPLYTAIRELIKEVWPQASIFNALASSEGIYARNCCADRQEMHLNDDIFIVEPVDQEGRRVALGETPEKLYLTNLINYTLPLIRYESPDQLVFLDKKCACGSSFQLIAEPQGRPEFDFVYPGDVFVHHLVFVTPLLHDKNIHEYQVRQTPNGAQIDIVSSGEINKRGLVQTITSSLIDLGLAEPELEINEVARFDYPVSGKLRRFVPLKLPAD